MTRVCHFTSVHKAEDVRIFHKECTSLAGAGYDVYLVAQEESYEKNGVHIVGAGNPPKGRLSRMASFAKKVYEAALAIDADIYHFHDAELLPYGLKLKKKGKTVIFDSHEDTLESILEKEWIPALLRKGMYQWFSIQQKTVCRQIDAVITVTPHMVRFFQTISPQVAQVANFPVWEESVAQPDFQSNRLVFAGGIMRDWNHHRIIPLLERIPVCRYSLCGPADEAYLQKLRALPGWQQVDYLGRLPHADVAAVLASGCIGLAIATPCRNSDWKNGTIGNTKIFEEMMAGLPVVCTEFALWKEFVDRHHCGICVNPENVDEIAAAIRYLLDNPDEARRMGENGRRAVKEEFNWAAEEKKLLAFYHSIEASGGTV